MEATVTPAHVHPPCTRHETTARETHTSPKARGGGDLFELSLLLIFALLCGACRSRQHAEPHAVTSTTAKIIARVVEMPRPSRPPHFRMLHLFPKRTNIWSVGSRLVACESSCAFDWAKDSVPRTWLVGPHGVDQQASLLPQLKQIRRPSVRYWGTYPDDVYALIELSHDSSEQHDVAFRYLGPGPGKRFVHSDPPTGSSLGAFVPGAFAPPEAKCESQCEPFELYDTEEEADWLKRHGPNTAGAYSGHRDQTNRVIVIAQSGAS
jgi:hypothetical protein